MDIEIEGKWYQARCLFHLEDGSLQVEYAVYMVKDAIGEVIEKAKADMIKYHKAVGTISVTVKPVKKLF